MTGAQAMLFVTCGTSDFALLPSIFHTGHLEGFLGHVLKVDPQEIVTRMEGFALQGLTGA